MTQYARELDTAVSAARRAGAEILARRGQGGVRLKSDDSPVTEADLAADRMIRTVIGHAFPNDAMLTEEAPDDPLRFVRQRCWIADPLDGTSLFVNGSDDFDVLIALIAAGRPIVAVAFQPATGLLLGATAGHGAWIETTPGYRVPLTVSRSGLSPCVATKEWLGSPGNLPSLVAAVETLGGTVRIARESLNIRSFAHSSVDAITGFAAPGRSLDAWYWDLAAADLILNEAGGRVTDINGQPISYDGREPRIGSILLSRDAALHTRLLRALDRRR